MQVTPYLMFDGRCEEAFEFYRSKLGAEVIMLMRFKDCPIPMEPGRTPSNSADKIMHMSFRIGDSTVMATDSQCQGQPTFQGFSLSIAAADDAEAERLFVGLAEGGEVRMPLHKPFFASKFGVVVDRFGVSWMIVAGA